MILLRGTLNLGVSMGSCLLGNLFVIERTMGCHCGPYCLPLSGGTELLFHVQPTNVLYPHFIDQEIEAQRD